jgi:hypothetical protein
LLGVENEIHLFGNLSVVADATPALSGGSSAGANFSDPFEITSVQLFDDQGQFIENVSLTDSFGNTLQVGPLAAVPEPSGLTLLGVGVFSLLGCCRRRRRRAA